MTKSDLERLLELNNGKIPLKNIKGKNVNYNAIIYNNGWKITNANWDILEEIDIENMILADNPENELLEIVNDNSITDINVLRTKLMEFKNKHASKLQ